MEDLVRSYDLIASFSLSSVILYAALVGGAVVYAYYGSLKDKERDAELQKQRISRAPENSSLERRASSPATVKGTNVTRQG